MVRPVTKCSFETLEPRQVLSTASLASGLVVAAQHANEHSHVFDLISSRLADVTNATHTVLNGTLSDATNSSITGSVHYLSLTAHGSTRTDFSVNVSGA